MFISSVYSALSWSVGSFTFPPQDPSKGIILKKNMDYLKAKYFKIHSISLYVFMCTCVCEGVPRDQKRSVRSLGAGVIGICELPDMGAEI